MPLGSAPLRTDFQSVTTTTKAPGRLETQTLTTSALLNAASDCPYLGQVFQLVRQVRFLKSGKTTHEVIFGVTSLSPATASPKHLLDLNRQHWAIENKLHYCRDVIFHEDAYDLAIGTASQAIALLNNLVLGLLRLRGLTAIAAARRRFRAVPPVALALILYSLLNLCNRPDSCSIARILACQLYNSSRLITVSFCQVDGHEFNFVFSLSPKCRSLNPTGRGVRAKPQIVTALSISMPDTNRSAIKPTHKAIQGYYSALQSYADLRPTKPESERLSYGF